VTAQVRPSSNTNTPSKNIAYMARVDSQQRIFSSATIPELDKMYGTKSGMFYNDGREKGTTMSQYYSAAKTWGVNKGSVKAKGDLKLNTTGASFPAGNTSMAADSTFIQIVLGDRADLNNVGHDQAIVTVKTEVMVSFVEHKTNQVTTVFSSGNDGGD